MTLPPTKRLRVMVDANVLVAGIAWPRLSYELLRHAVQSDFRLVLSSTVIAETRYTLAKLSPASINSGAFEDFLKTTPYEPVNSPTPAEIAAQADLVRDPKDVHVALAASTAHVDFLVTQDKDFIDHDESTRKVQQLLNIRTPGQFLLESMGWTNEALEKLRKRTWLDLSSTWSVIDPGH